MVADHRRGAIHPAADRADVRHSAVLEGDRYSKFFAVMMGNIFFSGVGIIGLLCVVGFFWVALLISARAVFRVKPILTSRNVRTLIALVIFLVFSSSVMLITYMIGKHQADVRRETIIIPPGGIGLGEPDWEMTRDRLIEYSLYPAVVLALAGFVVSILRQIKTKDSAEKRRHRVEWLVAIVISIINLLLLFIIYSINHQASPPTEHLRFDPWPRIEHDRIINEYIQ